MKYLTKDQNWTDATTIYWFEDSNGETFGISDCEGEKTALDCDGHPIDCNEQLKNRVLNECVITDEMIAE